jgi:methylase of polypeptide subunit release factors
MSINEKLTPHFTGDLALFANWRSENGWNAPKRFLEVDDTLTADIAYRYASEGTGLLWKGDFQNGRQLLQALVRRLDQRSVKLDDLPYPERFHRVRMQRAQRARTLGMLLLAFEANHHLAHRRAPDVGLACSEAYGASTEPYVVPFTEILGVISAHEWRKKGLYVPALEATIHAHYGVFAPTRSEYLTLLRDAPLPSGTRAMDIGTGTGAIALLLAKRGYRQIMASDTSPRALVCAQANVERLNMAKQITVTQNDLFPNHRADLIVCNPPWLPGKPSSLLEQAIYDPGQQMLKGFISGVGKHLLPNGQAWLIMSDLAEHLGLRTRDDLLSDIQRAGLRVIARTDIRPTHGKSKDSQDPLNDARSKEVTSLWRLTSVT